MLLHSNKKNVFINREKFNQKINVKTPERFFFDFKRLFSVTYKILFCRAVLSSCFVDTISDHK